MSEIRVLTSKDFTDKKRISGFENIRDRNQIWEIERQYLNNIVIQIK